ncbi:MAG TPA: hypothetical protein VM869_19975 [Enhygromyxa sp.]|nr:hypothetical protein [Enhygromyxa sp.]
MVEPDNPIEGRLEQLYDHWEAFVEHPSARLLRWCVRSNEFRCVEAFFAAEDDERAGRLPVVFLRFEDPFDDPLSYAGTLRERLLEAVELARADEGKGEAEAGGPSLAEFRPPSPTGNHLHDLMATAEALCRQQGPDNLPMLALVLMPARVGDPGGWMAWLRTAVQRTPAVVRLVVFDHLEAEALRPLADAEPERIVTEVIDMDLSAAAIEISAQAGNLDKPEGQFRHAYVQMLDAIGKQDLTAAQQHAAVGLDVAQRSGWGHLEVAVPFALGSGFLQAKQPQRAVELYFKAEQRAIVGESAGEAWAGPLRLKARLAMGAAAVMAEAWPQAAQLYADTAPLAKALAEPRTELDCLRMAAYCRANQGQMEDAWVLGFAALEVGEAMDAETRASSTMAHAGVGLERIAGHVHASWAPVEQRMIAALGSNWRPKNEARPS